jgi:DNA-binding response OmpR family regulator
VDDNPEGMFILTRTLNRKLPKAVMVECTDSDAAVVEAQDASVSVAVLHRSSDMDGLPLIERIRAANSSIPILYLATSSQESAAVRCGATKFLHYDKWLLVGEIVSGLLIPHGK